MLTYVGWSHISQDCVILPQQLAGGEEEARLRPLLAGNPG